MLICEKLTRRVGMVRISGGTSGPHFNSNMNYSPTASRLRFAIPFLACEDIHSTIGFYRDKLGFVEDWTWGNPVSDAGMFRDDVLVYFSHNPELARRVADQEVVIMVTNVDAIFSEHQSREAPICAPIENKPWGMREYSVRDPAGYVLRFTQEQAVSY